MAKPRKALQTTYLQFLKKNYLIIGGIIAFVLPIVLLALYTLIKSVNAPFWDQWANAEIIIKAKHGTLGLHDLWKQHNEHRILISRVILGGLGIWTHWNVRFEVLCNIAVAIGSLGIIIASLKRTLRHRPVAFGVVAIAIAWLLFSPLAWINWIWGFQLCWFLSIFGVVGTLWYINSKQRLLNLKSLWVPIMFGFIATYSLGNGMLIWPIAGLLLLVLKVKRDVLYVWAVASLAVISSYLYHYHRPESIGPSPRSILLHEPTLVLHYLFAYLGRNFGNTVRSAELVGILLTCLMLGSIYYLYRTKRLEDVYMWLALGLYVCGTAFLAALSRLGFGIEQSLSDSYTTVSVLFVIATLVVSTKAVLVFFDNHRTQHTKNLIITFALGMAVGVCVVGYVQNYRYGWGKMNEQSNHLKRVRACIQTVRSADDDCLLTTYPEKNYPWSNIEEFRAFGWSHFGKDAR